MQDLTTGSLTGHLLRTTSYMLVSMVFQTLYVLVDLYWVGRLGTTAVAAVGISGNLAFIVLAATQMLGVGTTTLVAHATGRRDQAQATARLQPGTGALRRRRRPVPRHRARAARSVCPRLQRRRSDDGARRANTCFGSFPPWRSSSASSPWGRRFEGPATSAPG